MVGGASLLPCRAATGFVVYRLFQQVFTRVHSVPGPVCDLLSASGKT